jgi:transcriptional regulator with XRE-family HTH domain
MSEMGNRIRELRINAGLTQEQLGDMVGLQKSAIAKYENGKTENMKRTVIQKMAEALGVSPAYLMGFEDDTPYYIDSEAAELAKEIANRDDLRILFDATRDISKEDMDVIIRMVEGLKK